MNAVITWIYPSLVFQSLAINLGCVYQSLSHNVYVNLRKMFRISFSKQIVNGWQRVLYWNQILLDRGRPRQSIAVTGLGCSNGDGACLHWLLKIGSHRSLLLIHRKSPSNTDYLLNSRLHLYAYFRAFELFVFCLADFVVFHESCFERYLRQVMSSIVINEMATVPHTTIRHHMLVLPACFSFSLLLGPRCSACVIIKVTRGISSSTIRPSVMCFFIWRLRLYP